MRNADQKEEPKRDRYAECLTDYPLRPAADQDLAICPVLVGVRLADTHDHRDLPFKFVREYIAIPRFRAAKMLPDKLADIHQEMIDGYARGWLANQKPKLVKRGRPEIKLMDMILVSAACAATPKGAVRREEYYKAIACRLGMKREWYQVRHLHQQFLDRRKERACQVCVLASDDVLLRIEALLRASDMRAGVERREKRFGRQRGIGAVAIRSASDLVKCEIDNC